MCPLCKLPILPGQTLCEPKITKNFPSGEPPTHYACRVALMRDEEESEDEDATKEYDRRAEIAEEDAERARRDDAENAGEDPED